LIGGHQRTVAGNKGDKGEWIVILRRDGMPGKNNIMWSCMVCAPMNLINGSLCLRMDNLKFKMQTRLTKSHRNN